MMSYAETLRNAGLTLSPEAEQALAALENVEREGNVVKDVLVAIKDIKITRPILIRVGEDGVVTANYADKQKGGNGKFGGNSIKVKGPFTNGEKTFATWHDATVEYGHTCKAGTEPNSAKCGYWAKVKELKSAGTVYPGVAPEKVTETETATKTKTKKR
mgnify:CR=1 FL=1